MKNRWTSIIATVSLIGIIFVAVVLIVSHIDKLFLAKEVRGANKPLSLESKNTPPTIIYNGRSYLLRDDLQTLLVIGLDDFGKAKPTDFYINTSQADFLALVIFDATNHSYKLLMINRDTMTDVPILGVNSKIAGKAYEQIALAHTYGTGSHDSCKNTTTAVSTLLLNVPVEEYISMTMDAVSKLNDIIGGVEVKIETKFADSKTLIYGETVRLTGEDALTFVRARGSVDDGTNLARMKRQKAYLNSFFKQLKAKYAENSKSLLNTYSDISDYTVSNLSVKELPSILENIENYTFDGIITLEGEAKLAGEYMEFHVDEEALYQRVIELFCVSEPYK